VATSDPIHNPELFCEVWPCEENQEVSDVTKVDRSGKDVTQDEDRIRLGASTSGMDFDAYVSVDQELVDVWCVVSWVIMGYDFILLGAKLCPIYEELIISFVKLNILGEPLDGWPETGQCRG
jgi:hypothetical protein